LWDLGSMEQGGRPRRSGRETPILPQVLNRGPESIDVPSRAFTDARYVQAAFGGEVVLPPHGPD